MDRDTCGQVKVILPNGAELVVSGLEAATTDVELHGYQRDFLLRVADAQNLGSDGATLQKIVNMAMAEPGVNAAIFDKTFHCVHCDSQSPPDWIQENKGEKMPYAMELSPEACQFLSGEILLNVGPPGPDKAVIPGPKHADADKAARCCIDWAIKEFAGEVVWFQLHGYQKIFLDKMADAQTLPSHTAALQKIVNMAMAEPEVNAAIFDETFHCVHCDSQSPPDWIQENKGEKMPYAMELSPEACQFLSGEILLNVGPPGPDKAVIPGPKHADADKAARCCIDWAIKEFAAEGKVSKLTLRTFDLHGYQADFLGKMGEAQGLGSDTAALQKIVDVAMAQPEVKQAIFDETFHCVHCDTQSPPDWIQEHKGIKTAHPLALSPEACQFLSGEILLNVGPPGPDKAVIPGPKHADADKAARCCIDWAIKEFRAEGVALGFNHTDPSRPKMQAASGATCSKI